MSTERRWAESLFESNVEAVTLWEPDARRGRTDDVGGLVKVDCPHCGGTGKVEVVVYCRCGHARAEHIAGFGCTLCSALYSDQCLRFKVAK